MKNTILKFIKILSVIFFIFIAFGAPFFWSAGKAFWYKSHPVPFTQSVWHAAEKENNANSTYIRLQMASALIQAGTLTNKSETEVIALLGNPQNHPAVPGSAYWLAPHALDSMWLQIIYENGVAKNVVITHD